MPLYDYLCDSCGSRFEEVFSIRSDSTTTPCTACASRGIVSLARKVITRFPGVTHGMVRETHFNTAVGGVVHSDAEFRSELSRRSDAESERNGFAVNFQAIDHRDAGEHLGVTQEGMDSTYAKEVADGKRDVVKHF